MMETYDTVTDNTGANLCIHGKSVYMSVTGLRHFSSDGGDLCDDKHHIPAPKYFLWRTAGDTNWTESPWGYIGYIHSGGPKSWAEAEAYLQQWNSEKAGYWQYKMPLHCERCYAIVSETFPSMGLPGMAGKHVCRTCHEEGVALMKQPTTGPKLVRKEGDIWTLPKATSPMWTQQWCYQGSSKTPYVISHSVERVNGSTTSDGWACSCPNFTRNSPRTPCKHILNIRLKEGYVDLHVKAKAKLANVDAEKLKAFEAWEREQAAAKKQGPADKAKLNLFGSTGRKFR